MDEQFETVKKFCPQCSETVDADARFCKYCAFDIANSDIYQDTSTEINQTKTKNNTPIILGVIGLLIVGIISIVGLVIFLKAGKNDQSVADNVNSLSQTSASALTLSEKGQQTEEKILRGETINASDLEGLSPQELRILRNVHFARYGRKYDGPGLGDYFYTRSWYKPNEFFNDTMLTSIDKENIRLILSIEKPQEVTSAPSNSSSVEEFEKETETPSEQEFEDKVEKPSKNLSEAQKIAENFWKDRIVKCGDLYYWQRDDDGRSEDLFECKHEPHIVTEGQEFTPRELTEVEKLNGVDPFPVEWSGSTKASFKVCRIRHKSKYSPDITWGRWRDAEYHSIPITKSKGKWYLENPRQNNPFVIVPVKCSNISRQ